MVSCQLTDFDLAEAENRPKSAHRYNVAEQQQIYKSEIERIWKAQFDSLSRKDEPQLTTEEDKEAMKKPVLPPPLARPSPAFSRAGSVDAGAISQEENRKVLRIKRLVSCLCGVFLQYDAIVFAD